MDYTSEIVELYSHTSYLEPKQFQIDIMNSIMNNIDLGKKMQAIKMPNTTGKTIMCNLLAVLLTRKGYKVVIYDPSASGRISKRKSNYSAPRLGYINFWSKQRKYNFCFIIALLRKVDNFSM